MNHRSNVYSITQSDFPRNATERDVQYERTGRRGAQKYLRENCYHRIKFSATNFLTALMWRKPLNSVVLTTPTQRGSNEVSDETSTQVVA